MSECDHANKYRDGLCLACWTKWALGQIVMLDGAITGWRNRAQELESALAVKDERIAELEQDKRIVANVDALAGPEMAKMVDVCLKAVSRAEKAEARIKEIQESLAGAHRAWSKDIDTYRRLLDVAANKLTSAESERDALAARIKELEPMDWKGQGAPDPKEIMAKNEVLATKVKELETARDNWIEAYKTQHDMADALALQVAELRETLKAAKEWHDLKECATCDDRATQNKCRFASHYDALSKSPSPDRAARIAMEAFEEVRHFTKGIGPQDNIAAGMVDEFCTRKIISLGGTFDDNRKLACLDEAEGSK